MHLIRQAFLRGREHQTVGRVELIGEESIAVALSRGGAKKTYSYTDPNEDCVGFAEGEGGFLIVAADGHHGDHGSEAAVQCILETFAPAWTGASAVAQDDDAWIDQGYQALLMANHAILEVAGNMHVPPAPTTFVLALARPAEDRLLALSVGDSHVFAVDDAEAIDLGGRDPDSTFTAFLGYEQATKALLEQYAAVTTGSLDGLRALVLATDGLSEPGIGVPDPAAGVRSVVAQTELEAPQDRAAVDTCRGVLELALNAHARQKAGDNMGVAVIWLP